MSYYNEIPMNKINVITVDKNASAATAIIVIFKMLNDIIYYYKS